jgi:starch-binding outer membrane protein, SusD/RagB family
MGEALFLRAFIHFYLVNLFGDVPLIKTSDYRTNTNVSRTPVAQVYDGIITDLLEAKDLLPDTYPSAGRVRANKGAAIALLARVYLYAGDFTNAEEQSTEIISKATQYNLQTNLNEVFLRTSEEAIWQLMPQGDLFTSDGLKFILVAAPPIYVTLRDELYNAFEVGDLRKTHWTNSLTSDSGFSTWYYAFKYKQNLLNATGAEYSMVLRLSEQYLIRAEARTQQGKIAGANSAVSDINVIRSRAGLPNTAAATKEELLAAIEQERRVELFTEWGHRFFDLKRTGRLDAVLSPVKPNWKTTNALLPIPQTEILLNANLKPQNPGY